MMVKNITSKFSMSEFKSQLSQFLYNLGQIAYSPLALVSSSLKVIPTTQDFYFWVGVLNVESF